MEAKRGRKARQAGMLLMMVGAVAAALSPDALTALKAQNYASGVDLALQMLPSTATPVAGGDLDFFVTATNAGPDPATRPRTIAGFQGDITLGATSGCTTDPNGFPQCFLPAPLAANGSADYLLHASLPPTARGEIQLAVAVTSDDAENQPGNEVAIYRASISAQLDLQASVVCQPHPRVQQPMACWFTFRNEGPSASLLPLLESYVFSGSPVSWSCQASRAELCTSADPNSEFYQSQPAALWPGEQVTFRSETIPDISVETVQLMSSATPGSNESDVAVWDNQVYSGATVSLFYDGFDSP